MLDPITAGATKRLGEITRRVARALTEAGVETPERDARRLLAAATGVGVAELIARPDRIVAQDHCDRLDELVRRRCAREPVSRILGEREFYGRPFLITPATLDPRPDSETLIEMALELAAQAGWRHKPLRILDVGTGSGCLLVTLLAELALATGLGTDVSASALAVAAENARRHGVSSRARFECRCALDGIAQPFDLVVCNPPYVATGEIAALAPEVRDFEPPESLDGGNDGLAVYRKIISAVHNVVTSGWVMFEVGAGQAAAVMELLRASDAGRGGGRLRVRKDLGGHVRCVAMEIQL